MYGEGEGEKVDVKGRGRGMGEGGGCMKDLVRRLEERGGEGRNWKWIYLVKNRLFEHRVHARGSVCLFGYIVHNA